MEEDGFDLIFKIVMGFFILGTVVAISGLYVIVYDLTYVKPIADNKANEYCQANGFDQYKSYSRVGIWSINPIGIKCEYAERYTDLGVRIN